ncbi:Smad-interacting and CPSF-like protein-like [Planoprotostelium fungivorum]|uniref:Smad-interacting and CPSF-like protein-like n=1 Tax=Planoprotostelium fungivorum TaxID=1890364 RepID=A0A2P6NUQ8_9EUKA|nr:Smad-interacting and CPSF-like protein-like [Planoprotostelium fungivorum]
MNTLTEQELLRQIALVAGQINRQKQQQNVNKKPPPPAPTIPSIYQIKKEAPPKPTPILPSPKSLKWRSSSTPSSTTGNRERHPKQDTQHSPPVNSHFVLFHGSQYSSRKTGLRVNLKSSPRLSKTIVQAVKRTPAEEPKPTCSFFLAGVCTKTDCPFSHVYIAHDAPVCPEWSRGKSCPRGNMCNMKHVTHCPEFQTKGRCLDMRCRLQHKRTKETTNTRDDKQSTNPVLLKKDTSQLRPCFDDE